MPEAVERYSHEMLKDFEHDVFVHKDAPEDMLHVSFNAPLPPDEMHRYLLRELNFRKRFQIGAYRHIPAEAEHAYEVLFKEAVPHDPRAPYPLSRIILRPSEDGGTEVHVIGPKNAEHHVAYLLQTAARALRHAQ